MLPIRNTLRSFLLLAIVLTGAASIDLVTRHLHAKEAPSEESFEQTLQEAAVVSDLSAEQMAREILILQQQMGGSIVKDPPHWNNESFPGKALITDQDDSGGWTAYPPLNPTPNDEPAEKIEELREAAFSLDTTAHRLEKLDLYAQADALRNVASRFRRDARELKRGNQAARNTKAK